MGRVHLVIKSTQCESQRQSWRMADWSANLFVVQTGTETVGICSHQFMYRCPLTPARNYLLQRQRQHVKSGGGARRYEVGELLHSFLIHLALVINTFFMTASNWGPLSKSGGLKPPCPPRFSASELARFLSRILPLFCQDSFMYQHAGFNWIFLLGYLHSISSPSFLSSSSK